MAGLTQLLGIARDALSAQAFGLSVTGQNVTNANTPEYVRREAILENRGGGVGGVVALGVRRVADEFAQRRYLASASLSSGASEREKQLASIEALFQDEGGNGLGSSISALFDSFQALSTNPSDPTARQTVLDRAQAVAARFRDTADALASRRDQLLQDAQKRADQTNAKASELAKLNMDIAATEMKGGDASDLKDKRDQLLLGLSELVDVKTFTDGQGQLVVQSAGTTLVEGGSAATFSVDLAPNGTLRLLASHGSGPASDVTSQLSGGALAADKEVRDADLGAISDKLDQLAYDLASSVNARHEAGFGLDGVDQRALFSITATSPGAARAIALDPNMLGHPEYIAASSSAATLPGGSDNATALAGIADSNVASGGTRTLAEAWGDLVGDVGTRSSGAKDTASMRDAIHAQDQSLRDSTSGVSIDEEMVSLSKYQHAYDAAAKVLTTVDELLRDLIAKVGS